MRVLAGIWDHPVGRRIFAQALPALLALIRMLLSPHSSS